MLSVNRYVQTKIWVLVLLLAVFLAVHMDLPRSNPHGRSKISYRRSCLRCFWLLFWKEERAMFCEFWLWRAGHVALDILYALESTAIRKIHAGALNCKIFQTKKGNSTRRR
jgi:hypothetical protein